MLIRLWVLLLSLVVMEIASPTFLISAESPKDNRVIQDGSVVSLQYTLTGEDGKLIESNKGKDPMKYTQGRQQIIPGLEKAMEGMGVGGEKHVIVKPEEGYGPVRKEAFQELPKEKIPPEALKVDTILTAHGPQGQAIPVRIHEIKEDTVILDFNHPMAGKTLVFDVKVLDIQPAQPPPAPQPAKPSQPAPPK